MRERIAPNCAAHGSLKKSAHSLSGKARYQSAGVVSSTRYAGSATFDIRNVPSARSPSLIPQRRVPVNVNASITRSKRVSSIALSVDSAFDANWIGPPNRANWPVFSYTVTSKPAFSIASAVVSPPTPPPATATLSGRSSSARGGASACICTAGARWCSRGRSEYACGAPSSTSMAIY